MAWGVVNGVLVAMAKVPALIVTLGTLSVALGLAQVLTGGIDIRSVPSELTDFSAYTKVLGIPGLPFVALVVVVLGGILLHKTRFGRYTYAIGSNEEAARRTGVKVTRHLVLSTRWRARSPVSVRSSRSRSTAPRRSPGSR